MKHYLLLRDNRQSGPHSFDELLAMGLRAHDLIWVDGKSAAWRYPAEFPEFKEHSPAVPEQPFDRFFRKPTAEQLAISSDTGAAVDPQQSGAPFLAGQDPDGDKEIPTLTRFMQEQEADKQKELERIRLDFPEHHEEHGPGSEDNEDAVDEQPRYVSVSLPAQDAERPIVVIGNPEPISEVRTSSGSESRTFREPDREMNVPPGKPVAALFPERDPLAPPRKPAPRQGQPWIQYAAILIGILSFMGLGILIGIKWTRQTLSAAETQRSATNLPLSSPPAGGTEIQNSGSPLVDTVTVARTSPLEVRNNRRQKKDSHGNKPLLSGELVHADVTKEMDPSVLQEEARRRREAEDKERTRAGITQVVGLRAGKYKVGVFGGISDLDVTVSNGSGYPMDQVVVVVDYFLSNDKIYKTETLRFVDLGPHGSKTLSLPRTGRGIKAESRITRIDSRELDLAWSRN